MSILSKPPVSEIDLAAAARVSTAEAILPADLFQTTLGPHLQGLETAVCVLILSIELQSYLSYEI